MVGSGLSPALAPVDPLLEDELSRAETAARRTTVVLAVFGFGAQTPATAWQQRRFCTYAKSALALVPDARAVVVWDEAGDEGSSG